ncbi:MAG: hypothetical protein K2N06_01400 [Oscillospiraceae bacterium]|nr:hypothetical protein [Oscillospiraceae bacterium]
MKLSKQERIGLMIIMAVVIIALGAFLMVKPKIEEMNRNKETMETKQKEFDEKKAKADTKSSLRTQIEAAYEKGEDTADMFFSEMDGYEVDDMFREFLENREYTKPDANKPEEQSKILIEELKIGNLDTETLSPSFLEIRPITYPLKQFATQGGVTLSKEEQAEQLRKAALAAALGGDQTIGATSISFTAKALSNDELIKFADEINNFVRKENGNVVRKAMKTQNIELTYNDITRKYDEMIEDMLKEAEADGKAAFERDFHVSLSGSGSSGSNLLTPTPDADNNNNNNKSNVSDYLCSWENTLTLYSVERMQNPKPILDAQDGIVSSEE